MNWQVRLGRVNLENPLVLASGTCGYGRELAAYLDLNRVGALTTKSLSYEPCVGNAPPRMKEVYGGILNSIGLENKGVHRFLEDDLPFLEGLTTKIFVGVWGKTVNGYVVVVRELERVKRIDAIELNVSCPNVEKGGATFLEDGEVLRTLVAQVRSATQKPLIVKLGPQVNDWPRVISMLEEEGVDILSLTNSFPALALDVERMDFFFARKFAGLSGPAVKPLALRMVYEVVGLTKLPVIGMGGIASAEDAVEFLLVGAKAVGVGSATLVDPQAPLKILEGLQKYLLRKGIPDIQDVIGKVRRNDGS